MTLNRLVLSMMRRPPAMAIMVIGAAFAVWLVMRAPDEGSSRLGEAVFWGIVGAAFMGVSVFMFLRSFLINRLVMKRSVLGSVLVAVLAVYPGGVTTLLKWMIVGPKGVRFGAGSDGIVTVDRHVDSS